MNIAEQNRKRLHELVEEYKQKRNPMGIVRLIGGSVNDLRDYTEADAGEEPRQRNHE